ncbi:MAG: transposase [Flavobacteriales bacterium]
MTKRTKRKFSAEFKAKVVIEALKQRYTIEEIARKHELHLTQIATWKKAFLANSSAAFGGDKEDDSHKEKEIETEKLFAQIGQLKVENDFLKKKLL